MSTIRGPRTRSVVTFNPSTIGPGEELYINIPKLKPSSCLVPGSLSLLFDFKNSNTKSRFMNNISKLLAQRLQIKVAGETAYDCSGESLFEVYKDLWLTLGDRKKMIEQGVANENIRKLFSGDDSGVKVGDASKVADALVRSIYGTKLKKPIDKIIGDHGLYTPFTMNNNPMYILTLPEASEIMVAQGGQKVDGYKLENLELEYETIENDSLASEISSMYTTTINWNTTYLNWSHLNDHGVIKVPCSQEMINHVLQAVSIIFRGSNTLIIVDDCASSQAVKQRVSELVRLAFSARHYNLSVVVLTQQLSSVAKPFRENISRLVTFYNPSRKDMKVITDDYLNGVPQETITEIIKILRGEKFTALDILLVHPYTYTLC